MATIKGVHTNYERYSLEYDRAVQAMSGGLSKNPLNFPITHTPEFLGKERSMGYAPDMQNPQNSQNGAAMKNKAQPDMPYPQPERRHDLDEQYIPRVKPGMSR